MRKKNSRLPDDGRNNVGTLLDQCWDGGLSLSSLLKFFEKNIKKGGYVRKFTP